MSFSSTPSRWLLLLGAIVVTYGATRWWTVRDLIMTHEEIVDTVHREYAVDAGQDVFSLAEVSKEVALIRQKMFNSQGPHQWTKGLILTTAAGLVIILTGLYVGKTRPPPRLR